MNKPNGGRTGAGHRVLLVGISAVGGTLVLAAIFVRFLTRHVALTEGDWGFRGTSILPSVGLLVVGAVIARQRPKNPIGWIFLAGGLAGCLSAFALEYAVFTLIGGNDLPGGAIAAWLNEWLWSVAIGAIGIFGIAFFPNGRLRSRTAAVILIGGAVSMTGLMISVALSPERLGVAGTPNPFAVARLEPLLDAVEFISIQLFLAFVLASAISLVTRLRRAEPIERQQIKWVAFAAPFVPIFNFAGAMLDAGPRTTGLGKLVQSFGLVPFAGIAVAIGIAVLRYRLYEIDRLISRTISYAIVTMLLAATFGLTVLAPTVVVGDRGTVPDYLIAAATLVAVTLFRPVRRRVQDAVDHRFNRKRYDAQRTIESFTARLREHVDIDALGAELTAIVRQTMQPSSAFLWVQDQMMRSR